MIKAFDRQSSAIDVNELKKDQVSKTLTIQNLLTNTIYKIFKTNI